MTARSHLFVDNGNGGTTAILVSSTGKIKTMSFPSFRAMTTGETINLPTSGGMKAIDYQWSEWRGFRYVVGDHAMRVGSETVETHRGRDRLGDEFQQHMIAHAAALLGIGGNEAIDLTVFCPPGLYNECAQTMRETFLNAKPEIFLKGDGKPRKWEYANVTVRPEGAVAAACLLFDKKGVPTGTDLLKGRFLIVDGGSQTLDVIELVGGNLNPARLESATYDGQGVHTHIIRPILEHFKREHDFLNIGHVDAAIRNGVAGDGFILDPEGLALNIEGAIRNFSRKYADWIINNVLNSDWRRLTPYPHAMLIGGMAHLSGGVISDYYNMANKGKILDLSKIPSTKGVDLVDINAVSASRIALYQMAQAGS